MARDRQCVTTADGLTVALRADVVDPMPSVRGVVEALVVAALEDLGR